MLSARNQRRLELKSWKGRKCGDCTGCCYVLGVEELEKRSYAVCANVCDKGCQIYANRPTVCRTYSCAWKMGKLPDAFFPKDCGVVVDTTNALGATSVREIWPGASEQPEIKHLIRLLAKNNVTIVIRGEQDRTLLGPSEMVSEFMQTVAKISPASNN
jgi:hypothetical protein